MYLDEITKEDLKSLKERACCLVPKNLSGVSCHENDFCGCEVLALIKEIERIEKISIKALGHYGNRMDSGGTARRAIKEIKRREKRC